VPRQFEWKQADNSVRDTGSLDKQMRRRRDPGVDFHQLRVAIVLDHEIEAAEPAQSEPANELARRFGHLWMINDSDDGGGSPNRGRLDDLEADQRQYLSVHTCRCHDRVSTTAELLGVHNRIFSPAPGGQRIQLVIDHRTFQPSE